MSEDIKLLAEEYFAPRTPEFNYKMLLEMVEEAVLAADGAILTEAKEGEKPLTAGQKFIMYLPKWSPNENWGDPSSLERKQVEDMFKHIRGNTLSGRLDWIRKFLTPGSARKKQSKELMVNTMMVMESLMAAMNSFGESPAGFVFEAFMSMVTQGHQQAGRVGGTLPIEDMVAFSQTKYGKTVPVSLKLLSQGGHIKGSFTNLVDYLFVRGGGKGEILYLVAYKNVGAADPTVEGGKGDVVGLELHEFVINRENLLKFIEGSMSSSKAMLKQNKRGAKKLKQDYYAALEKKDYHRALEIVMDFAGGSYTSSGMAKQANAEAFVKKYEGWVAEYENIKRQFVNDPRYRKDWAATADPADIEQRDEEKAARDERLIVLRSRLFDKEGEENKATYDFAKKLQQDPDEKIEPSPLGEFHAREKHFMKLLTEGKKKEKPGTQWEVSLPALRVMHGKGKEPGTAQIDLVSHDPLDFSPKMMEDLSEIYGKKLEETILPILESMSNMTTNIGKYFANDNRRDGIQAGTEARTNATNFRKSVQADITTRPSKSLAEVVLNEKALDIKAYMDLEKKLYNVVHVFMRDNMEHMPEQIKYLNELDVETLSNKMTKDAMGALADMIGDTPSPGEETELGGEKFPPGPRWLKRDPPPPEKLARPYPMPGIPPTADLLRRVRGRALEEQKKKLNPDTLIEMVEEALDIPPELKKDRSKPLPSPQDDHQRNLKLALRAIEQEGYEHKVVGKNKIKILDDQRDETMEKMRSILEPLGFVYNAMGAGSSIGRLEIQDRKFGSVYVFVKVKSRTAASAGMDFEEQMATIINDKYSHLGISAKSAGFGHGSDLTISKGGTPAMTIELKTALSADFGQFRVQFDPSISSWEPRKTKGFVKNENVFLPLFDEHLKDWLNANAVVPIGDKRLRLDKNGKITGLVTSETTGELKRQLQSSWFGGKTDLKVPFDFAKIANYYADKGDSYIQIDRHGLYALKVTAAQEMNIPMFADLGYKAELRVRFKPSMGANSNTSFTVAVKLKGKTIKSNLSLTNEADLDQIIATIS
jgi:hypothetical protein